MLKYFVDSIQQKCFHGSISDEKVLSTAIKYHHFGILKWAINYGFEPNHEFYIWWITSYHQK